jgi:hypothetical protein
MLTFIFGFIASASALTLKGDPSCAYGTKGCNACVNNVREAFKNIGDDRSHRHSFHNNGLGNERWRIADHIQSVARIPGLDQENWMVMTRGGEHKGEGGLYLVPFRDIRSNGGAWKHADSRKSDSSQEAIFHPVYDTIHSGGVQPLGTLLFVANECGSGCDGQVDVIDVSNPKEVKIVSKLLVAREELSLVNEHEQMRSKASSVASVKLTDGRYLTYVGGRISGRYGWFYASDSTQINEQTNWSYLNNFHSADDKKMSWGGWENAAFLTECGSGDIYYVGMGERKSRAQLYKVIERDQKLGFEFVAKKNLDGSLLNSMRLGGGIHITPEHELVMYSSTRHGKRINEFRPR